jgi:hypothetical protein
MGAASFKRDKASVIRSLMPLRAAKPTNEIEIRFGQGKGFFSGKAMAAA